MSRCLKWLLPLLLLAATYLPASAQTLPADSVHADTLAPKPPPTRQTVKEPEPADTSQSAAGQKLASELAGYGLVPRCLKNKTADIRFFAVKTTSGYDPHTWGGGLGLGVHLFDNWRLGGDLSWISGSGQNKRYWTCVMSATRTQSVGRRWSMSLSGYAGPSFSSMEGDKPVAGISGNISFFRPSTLSGDQHGAFGIYAEPYYESGGRFGLRIGFTRLQPH